MPVQNPRFKILVNGTDITSDVSSINVGHAANQFPNARLSIDNKDAKFSTGSELDPETSVLISGSLDGGQTFVQLFSGSILTTEIGYAPNNPDTIDVGCQDTRLRRHNIQFNNAVQKLKDIGGVFTGSNTDSSGDAWFNQDSQGNWPDGLLRDSGFTYSAGSVVDIYADVDDLDSFVHGNVTTWDAITTYRNLFALDVFMDSINDEFTVLRHNEDYPTTSVTFSLGTDINQSSLTKDGSNKAPGMRVVGQNSFFQLGVEPFETIFDEEITTFANARQRAEEEFNTKNQTLLRGQLTVPADTSSVFGKRVTVVDPDHGWSGIGNVISVQQSITPSRWTTDFGFENVKRTPDLLLSDILETLEETQDKENEGIHFNGFLKIEHPTLSATASRPNQKPVALVYGDSAASPSSVNMSNTIGLVSIAKRIEEANAVFFNISDLETTADFSENRLTIKELGIVTNDTGAAYQAELNPVMAPPTSNGQQFTFAADRFVRGVDFIDIHGPFLNPNSQGIQVYSWHGLSSDHQQSPHTGSFWTEDVDVVPLTSEQVSRVSWDEADKTIPGANGDFVRKNFDVNLPTDADFGGWLFLIDTGLSDNNVSSFLDDLFQFYSMKMEYTEAGGPNKNSFRVSYWDESAGQWSDQFTSTPEQTASIGTWVRTEAATPIPLAFLRTARDGRIYIKIRNSSAAADPSIITASFGYAHHYLKPNGDPIIIDKAQVSRAGTKLTVTHPINKIHGLFTASDGTGKDLLRLHTDELWETREVRAYKLPDPFGAFPLPAFLWHEIRVQVSDFFPATTGYSVDNTTIFAPPEKSWKDLVVSWADKEGDPAITEETLFLKYEPEGAIVSNTRIPIGQSVLIDRHATGVGVDNIVFTMPTDSSQQNLPYNHAGTNVTLSYTYFATESEGVGSEGIIGRLTSDVGLDKTPEKTLNVMFAWTASDITGGGGGAFGSAGKRTVII